MSNSSTQLNSMVSKSIVTKIDIADIETTYNGEQGCACGCGGDYVTPEENLSVASKRLARINARLKSNPRDVEFGANYISLEGETRATRVYVKSNLDFFLKFDGSIVRTEKVGA